MRVTTALTLALVSLASTALAQPAARAQLPPRVPTRAVPCLPDGDLELTATDGNPVVCWGAACMAPEFMNLDAKLVAKPAPTPAWPDAAVVKTQGDIMSVCVHATCKPVGPKLAAAIALARADNPARDPVSATTDFKAVVTGSEVWSVAKDKPLKLKAPSSYKGGGDKPSMVGAQAAGALLVVDWSNCAGPCTVGQLVDSNGGNKGASFAGGGPVVWVDADHFATVSEFGDVHVFTMKGKATGAHDTHGDPGSITQVVRLADGDLAVMREEISSGIRLQRYGTYEGVPHLSSERSLPRCTP